jgi:hypothetical protein
MIMIDPMENGGAASTAERDLRNTKISALVIDETANKDVLFRLASGSAAVHADGAPRNRSLSYLNSLLLFNFTDDAGSTENLTYTIEGTSKSHTWHPTHWNKLDVYVQQNSEVTSNLLLGPFGHKFNDYLDYWSWGNFVDNWHGTTFKEYATLWPYASSSSTNGGHYLGLPVFPVDYGKNASFWLLDGRSNRYFRVMQGANIIEGTVYSTRPTLIGGGLLREGTGGETRERVNESMSGYSAGASGSHTLYVDAVVRYDQLIYNTDILLKSPSSGTAQSRIQPPYTWRQKTTSYNVFDRTFEPTMAIKGGTIYVDARQDLTIQGATLDNMWINPDSIVVAQGGSLTIQQSAYTNVLTNIYVNGGSLVIEAGARIKGNIYVYNGGTVEIQGDFRLDSTHDDGDDSTLTSDEAKNGILIYGSEMAGRASGISALGTLILPALNAGTIKITGSANRVHMLGTIDATTLCDSNHQAFPDTTLRTIRENLLDDGCNPVTGICEHYGPIRGDWAMGEYVHE